MSRPAAKEDAAVVAAPTEDLVVVLAVSNASTRFKIPSILAGKWVRVTCDGDDADMVFGDSAVSVSYGKTSSVTSESITVSSLSGDHFEDGVSDSFIMPKAVYGAPTHFAVKTSTGAAKLYIRRSGG